MCWAQQAKTNQENINQPGGLGEEEERESVSVCDRACQSENRPEPTSSSPRNEHQERGMEGARDRGPWMRKRKRRGFCLTQLSSLKAVPFICLRKVSMEKENDFLRTAPR